MMLESQQGLLLLLIGCGVFLEAISADDSKSCPTNCTCDFVKREVVCTDVRDKNLQEIAKKIKNQRTLRLSGSLTTLGQFFSAPNVEYLILNNNNFVTVPANISRMFPNVKTLSMKVNQIRKISQADFFGMNKLKQLLLNENNLTKLTNGTFQSLTSMTELEVSKNLIQSMSKDSFIGLKKLLTLDLSNNMISTLVPGVFSHFTSNIVKEIKLQNNQIKIIPNGVFSYKNFGSLELTLGNNFIDMIEAEAFQNSTIDLLAAEKNRVSTIPVSAIAHASIRSIVFTDNPLFCDCRTAEFLIKTKRYWGECAEPLEFRNKSLSDLVTTESADEIRKSLCSACELNNTCLNNGRCVSVKRTESSCECVDNFSGDFCQRAPVERDDSPAVSKEIIITLVFVFLIVLLLVVAGVMYFRRKREKESLSSERRDSKILNEDKPLQVVS